MPSGGGSAGGGGGGGNWSSSRSYSYGYSKRYRSEVYYSNGEDCNCCDCDCDCSCCAKRKGICIPLAVLLPATIVFIFLCNIILPVSFGALRQGKASSSLFSPGDTRIVSYGSSSFCAGITLTDQSTSVGSTLYLIADTPPLTDQNNFTIINNELTIGDNNYRYWNYYLYPNSGFTAELCTLPNSAGGVFYLIKGTARFEKWMDKPTTDLAVGFFSIGSLPCSEPNHRFSFRARFEDEYYLVYYNNNHYTNLPFLRLNLSISFNRFQYSTDDLDSVANCSVDTTGECTLTVPYGSDYRALIVTDIPDNPDWEENVDVGWHCVERGWAFAVVVLVPITVAAMIIGTIVLAITYCIVAGKLCCRNRDTPPPTIDLEKVDTSKNEPVDETKSSPPVEVPATSEDDDFKSVDPS